MSVRWRTLITNTLLSSSLWHDGGSLLWSISPIQEFHWLPQAVLLLPKDKGGEELVQLASKAVAFRLQFGPQHLVWRPER